jgi:DNA-binding transcriptional LysR family regulator
LDFMKQTNSIDRCNQESCAVDIVTARTFLEIVKTGSFVRAAANLNITQTAVSARVRVLEQQLDRQLFIRNKAGARMTPAGERFLRHATTLVQVWERARHQLGVPTGHDIVVSVGAEHSVWNPLLLDWLIWMRRECPNVAIRAHIDAADRLVEQVQEGVLDLAIVYAPPHRTGLITELLVEDTLVPVTADIDRAEPSFEDYVYVDWGSEFQTSHQAAYPEAASPALLVNDGPLALEYVLAVGGTGYFRMTAVRPHLDSCRLRLLADRPRFSYSVHAVYSGQTDRHLVDRIRAALRAVV